MSRFQYWIAGVPTCLYQWLPGASVVGGSRGTPGTQCCWRREGLSRECRYWHVRLTPGNADVEVVTRIVQAVLPGATISKNRYRLLGVPACRPQSLPGSSIVGGLKATPGTRQCWRREGLSRECPYWHVCLTPGNAHVEVITSIPQSLPGSSIVGGSKATPGTRQCCRREGLSRDSPVIDIVGTLSHSRRR